MTTEADILTVINGLTNIVNYVKNFEKDFSELRIDEAPESREILQQAKRLVDDFHTSACNIKDLFYTKCILLSASDNDNAVNNSDNARNIEIKNILNKCSCVDQNCDKEDERKDDDGQLETLSKKENKSNVQLQYIENKGDECLRVVPIDAAEELPNVYSNESEIEVANQKEIDETIQEKSNTELHHDEDAAKKSVEDVIARNYLKEDNQQEVEGNSTKKIDDLAEKDDQMLRSKDAVICTENDGSDTEIVEQEEIDSVKVKNIDSDISKVSGGYENALDTRNIESDDAENLVINNIKPSKNKLIESPRKCFNDVFAMIEEDLTEDVGKKHIDNDSSTKCIEDEEAHNNDDDMNKEHSHNDDANAIEMGESTNLVQGVCNKGIENSSCTHKSINIISNIQISNENKEATVEEIASTENDTEVRGVTIEENNLSKETNDKYEPKSTAKDMPDLDSDIVTEPEIVELEKLDNNAPSQEDFNEQDTTTNEDYLNGNQQKVEEKSTKENTEDKQQSNVSLKEIVDDLEDNESEIEVVEQNETIDYSETVEEKSNNQFQLEKEIVDKDQQDIEDDSLDKDIPEKDKNCSRIMEVEDVDNTEEKPDFQLKSLDEKDGESDAVKDELQSSGNEQIVQIDAAEELPNVYSNESEIEVANQKEIDDHIETIQEKSNTEVHHDEDTAEKSVEDVITRNYLKEDNRQEVEGNSTKKIDDLTEKDNQFLRSKDAVKCTENNGSGTEIVEQEKIDSEGEDIVLQLDEDTNNEDNIGKKLVDNVNTDVVNNVAEKGIGNEVEVIKQKAGNDHSECIQEKISSELPSEEDVEVEHTIEKCIENVENNQPNVQDDSTKENIEKQTENDQKNEENADKLKTNENIEGDQENEKKQDLDELPETKKTNLSGTEKTKTENTSDIFQFFRFSDEDLIADRSESVLHAVNIIDDDPETEQDKKNENKSAKHTDKSEIIQDNINIESQSEKNKSRTEANEDLFDKHSEDLEIVPVCASSVKDSQNKNLVAISDDESIQRNEDNLPKILDFETAKDTLDVLIENDIANVSFESDTIFVISDEESDVTNQNTRSNDERTENSTSPIILNNNKVDDRINVTTTNKESNISNEAGDSLQGNKKIMSEHKIEDTECKPKIKVISLEKLIDHNRKNAYKIDDSVIILSSDDESDSSKKIYSTMKKSFSHNKYLSYPNEDSNKKIKLDDQNGKNKTQDEYIRIQKKRKNVSADKAEGSKDNLQKLREFRPNSKTLGRSRKIIERDNIKDHVEVPCKKMKKESAEERFDVQIKYNLSINCVNMKEMYLMKNLKGKYLDRKLYYKVHVPLLIMDCNKLRKRLKNKSSESSSMFYL